MPAPTSLADFAASWAGRARRSPSFALGAGPPLDLIERLGLGAHLDDLLDTIVALQRAEWLQDGVFLSRAALPDVFADLAHCAHTLGAATPPTVVGPCPPSEQGCFGSDRHPYVRASSLLLTTTTSPQRRFTLGREVGHIAAGQVSWSTLYALLVDQGGVRRVARQALGPALELFLAPISVGTRVALSAWHRAAELSADRAGLLCAGDLTAAQEALLRNVLGVDAEVDVARYVAQATHTDAAEAPSRWAEALASQPWTHKRLRALELFARSELWVTAGHDPVGDELLSHAELDERTRELLRVLS